MSRTVSGLFFYGPSNLNFPGAQQGVGAGTLNWVRNGVGDFSINNVAGAATFNIYAALADLKRPFINFPNQPGQGTILSSNELQEAFGTASGTPGNPFSGGQTGSLFGTPALPWGLAVLDIFAVYSVQTAGLVAATLSLSRLTYAENAVFGNAQIIPATGLALTTTTGAGTPHVQKVSIAQPIVFETSDFSDLLIELVLQAAATSAIRVYGVGMHVAAEFE